jgi:NCS2 family nucleobase:cation symporter-2
MPNAGKLLYNHDQLPPPLTLLLSALQQACLLVFYLIILKVILQASGINQTDSLNIMRMGLVVMAIAAILQALKCRVIGSGFLAPAVLSAIYLQASILAVHTGGLSLLFGMTLFAGVIEIITARFIHSLRYIFTPQVIGSIVCIVGVQLGMVGIHAGLDIKQLHQADYQSLLLVAAVVFLIVMGLNVWAKGCLKIFAALIGLAAGFAAALLLGVTHFTELHTQTISWFALPVINSYGYSFNFSMVIPFLICGIVSALRATGSLIVAQTINDKNWHHPDYNNIKKGIFTDGMANCIAGLLGTTGINIGPSLVGLSKVSGVASRYVGFAIGVILLLLSLTPKFVMMFIALPAPIMGVVLLFNAIFMFVAGVQLICAKPLTIRSTIVVGFALLMGISYRVYPEFYHQLPAGLQLFLNSELSIVTISGIILTLLFRVGIKQKANIYVNTKAFSLKKFEQEFVSSIIGWPVKTENVTRAKKVVSSILKILQEKNLDIRNINVKFLYDDLVFAIVISYEGIAINFSFLNLQQVDELVEEQAFSSGLIRLVQGDIPDEYHITQTKNNWQIKLMFFDG